MLKVIGVGVGVISFSQVVAMVVDLTGEGPNGKDSSAVGRRKRGRLGVGLHIV